jgi:PAS domain S-box-containing protein
VDRQHDLALDAKGMGEWRWDLATGEMTATEGARALLGLPPRGALDYGRLLGAVHPEDRELVDRALRRALAGRRDYELEHRCVAPDGTLRWLHARGCPHWDDAGRPVRLHGVVLDVTARRRAEEQLRQVQRLEAVGQLAGGIAHDFRNYLAVIAANLDLLAARSEGGAMAARAAARGQAAAESAGRLIGKLLTFARAQELRPEPLDLRVVLLAFEELLGRALPRTVRLSLELPPALRPVTADRALLESALLNLVVNARDAMPEEGGQITIRVSDVAIVSEDAAESAQLLPGDYAEVAVADTGYGMAPYGMAPETLARAFEPFFTTKAAGEGTGLGLSQVYGFAEQSGGRAVIESREGIGTMVRVLLPWNRADP